MKSIIMPIFVFLISIYSVLYSCSYKDPFEPSDVSPAEIPSDWVMPHQNIINIKHIKVDDVNKKKVPAIKIQLPPFQSPGLILPTFDGGCIAITQYQADEKTTESDFRIIRFKADGSIKLDKIYEDDLSHAFPVSLCVYPDDGFIVSARKSNGLSSLYDSKEILYRFSAEGENLWHSEESLLSDSFGRLIALPDGALITAGSDENNEICIMRFENDGERTKQLILNKNTSAYLSGASYSEGTGLVLSWVSESKGTEFQEISNMVCFDENLNEIWTTVLPEENRIYEVKALADNKGILAYGSIYTEISKSVMFYFTDAGNMEWCYAADEKNWILDTAILDDGRIIGSQYNASEEGEETKIFLFSDEGENIQDIDLIPGIIEKITATKDGGFTVLVRQNVSVIPQPPYVSSIWTDTEAIIAHYDKCLSLKWKRTIDQFRNELRKDLVIFTTDDRLMIG